MTHDDWATEMRRRYMVLKAVQIIAAHWVDDGIIGRLVTDRDARRERDDDLEDVARAWVELIEWQRREPRVEYGR
jgi:hypothetical protein